MTLHLSCLRTTNEVLEFIQSRCSLERLTIRWAVGLTRLTVNNSSSKLKYLKINKYIDLEVMPLNPRSLLVLNIMVQLHTFHTITSLPSFQVDFTAICSPSPSWPPRFWPFKCLLNQQIKLSAELGTVSI